MMSQKLLLIILLVSYGTAVIVPLYNLNSRSFYWYYSALILGALGWAVQGILLYQWIDTPIGQNLTYLNVFAMVTWFNSLVVLLVSLYRPLQSLSLFVLPVAMGAMIGAKCFVSYNIVHPAHHPGELIHIFLAIIAISLFFLGALQALLLFLQQSLLRSSTRSAFIQQLPALETNESMLFIFLSCGLFFLGLVLVLSMMTFNGFNAPAFQWRVTTTIITWLIFAILLTGRFLAGWRGRIAIYWTLIGSGLLGLSYFISHWLN